MLYAISRAAELQDRDGSAVVAASLFGLFPFLRTLSADAGYQGPTFRTVLKRVLGRGGVEIVKRSDHAKGFVIMPKRWVVARTTGRLHRCRRLAKAWENLNRRTRAFLRLDPIRLMLREFCNAS